MFRPDKEKLVDKMKTDLARSQAVLFLDFTGLTVAEERQFRRKIRDTGGGYQVVKNALMRRVLTGTPAESAGAWLKGSPTSVVLGFDDPVAVARTTYE
ncbi:MAG: 50S ribosomal protein L10, partial [Deltaproteobacteria bacterium]|nr:50S ribosomal protein L10 [Deltaproteobacteria bacterium]